ncbi:MAG: hypothetical protein LBN39_10575, partial [Planctomycetaceae bacterium]|nr:hypothetical protein [Planctomycetaceae bacterium]
KSLTAGKGQTAPEIFFKPALAVCRQFLNAVFSVPAKGGGMGKGKRKRKSLPLQCQRRTMTQEPF